LTDQLAKNDNPMNLITSDKNLPMAAMLEGYDCPAILVAADYQILATNQHYQRAFGELDSAHTHRCFEVSHGYLVPCDQAGEDCPLGAASKSGHRERVLHIHQTPRGKEHVDVEMLPILNEQGELLFFVELLHPVPLASGAISDQELVGESPAFKKMLEKISRVGATEASALLLGESGTGKELAARAIHMRSARKNKPLVTLECAGLSDALFESELFGHVKGAFTGAQFNKKGLVELADGGTLFLDELGDIPLSMQVKLLRLLESKTFRAVGSAEVKTADFRLICATHKNLLQLVETGQFRADLYYRVNVFPIYIPSLAERISDLPLLANTLLQRMDPQKEYQLTKSALTRLSAYPFRGNIRELRNLLNRAMVLSDTNTIDEQVIELCLEPTLGDPTAPAATDTAASNNSDTVVDLKTHEQSYIQALLSEYGGDKQKVARLLGISVRSLYRKLDQA